MSKKTSSIDLLSEDNIKKYVLPEYSLENANLSRIKFKDTDKQRAVYKVEAPNGTYCLKKMYFAQGSVLFVYSAIEWLYRKNIFVPKILETNNKGRFINYENMLFILTPWIEGEKCSYDNIDHILMCSENLGRMHLVSQNFRPIEGSLEKYCQDELSLSIAKHFSQMLLCSNLAYKYNDNFSGLFLKHFEENFELAKLSMEACLCLDSSRLSTALCHLDYVNKNIIFDENKNIWVIDFDKCGYDYCVHDISYFLRRMLKRDNTAWDLEIAINCLNSYEKLKPLNKDEYMYILCYLAFPQKFWKISRDYYNNIKKCNHHSFYSILASSVENEKEQMNFALKFKAYIEKKFK
ncbi:MAG: CotS family spore coat protein [Solirubrobacterales bacterium]